MTTQDDLSEIRAIGAGLDPGAVAAEVSFLTGARLKAWSAGSGVSHSSEPALPLPDKLDRKVKRDHQRYKRAVGIARTQLELAQRIESELLFRHTLKSANKLLEMEAGPKATTCSNCGAPIAGTRTDRAFDGRCRPCADYLKAHGGKERPPELIEKAIP